MRNANGIKNPFRNGNPKLILRLLYATLFLVPLLAGSLVIAPTSPVQAAMVWTSKCEMLVVAANGAVAVGGNGRVYYFGGANPDLWTNQEYNPDTDTWRYVANMPTGRFLLGGATDLYGNVYAIAGWESTGPSWGWYTGVTEAYDPGTNTWASKAVNPNPRNTLATATGTDGLIYAIGGTYYQPYIGLNFVEAYDPATNTWTEMAPMPTARHSLAAVGASNGKIYAIGGYRGFETGDAHMCMGDGYCVTDRILNTVEEYDPFTKTWAAKAPMPTARFGLTAVATPDGKIYAIGGFYGSDMWTEVSGYYATVEVYDTATNTWATETPMTSPRLYPKAAFVDDMIYVFGGYRDVYSPLKTVEAATAAPAMADTTTSVTSSQSPSTYGQAVSFTATVSPVPPATGTPTGTVQFKIDGSDFGTPVIVSGGSATSGATSTLTVGNHTVGAVYSGDANFNYSTSPNFTQTVNKAAATVTLSNLTHTYDGSPKSVTVTTTPPGLSGVSITYNGSTTAPTNADSYAVVASLTNDNYQATNATGMLVINKATATVNDEYYQGSASGTFVINKAAATITLGNLNQTYDGTPKSVTVTTNPLGLSVEVKYSGNTTPPTNAGNYSVVATVMDPNYTGSANDTLVITGTTEDPIQLLQNLINYVKSLGLPKGTENSLTSKLDNAIKSLQKGNETAAINQINAFINEVEAQRGKKIPDDQAKELIRMAENIISSINL